MVIKSLTIQNFKGIHEPVRIDLKPITLLFGPNSAGKSTIIQALHYAWEVLEYHNLDPNFTTYGGESVDLGSFKNMVYSHDTSHSISLRFDLDLSHAGLPLYADPEAVALTDSFTVLDSRSVLYWDISHQASSAWVEFQVSWNEVTEVPQVSSYSVGMNEILIASICTSEDGKKTEIDYINFFHPLFFRKDTYFENAFTSYLAGEDKTHIGADDTITFLTESLSNAFNSPESWFDPEVIPLEHFQAIELAASTLKLATDKLTIDDLYKCIEQMSKDERKELINCLIQDPAPDKTKNDIFSKNAEPGLKLHNAVSEFMRLEFWLFCREFFGVKTLDGKVNIACFGQQDALPQWDKKLAPGFTDSDKQVHNEWESEAVIAALSQILVGPGEILRDALGKFRYLGPVRSSMPRNYIPNRYVDKRRWANGLAAWDALHRGSQEFVEEVGKWISDRLECGYRLHRKLFKELDLESDFMQNPDSDKVRDMRSEFDKLPTKSQLSLTDEASGTEVYLPDVGTGITQVLPVVVAVLYNGAGILAIEQPELHIHPALQVNLGDLFISEVAKTRQTFIIETHSEHLMLRFLRRIRETGNGELPPDREELKPEQLAVYYIESGENGMSLSRVRIDEEGDFTDPWPRGFFSERVRELY